MSGVDTAARGIASRARDLAGRRPRILMAAGASGPIYGGAGAGFVPVHSVTLPANAIIGGSTLRFRMQIAKYLPHNAGIQWRLRLGGVPVAINALGGGLPTFRTEQDIHIAYDRKFAFVYNLNTLDTPGLNTAGLYASTGIKAAPVAALGARQTSTHIAFVAYSSPPTTETVLVDFAQPVTAAIEIQVVNGDTAEVLGATLEMLSAGDAGGNFAHGRATAIWGDSLVEGSGSSPVSGVPMDLAAQLRRQRPGWPIAAKGLGGQKSLAIADRLLSDPAAGGAGTRCCGWARTISTTISPTGRAGSPRSAARSTARWPSVATPGR